MDAGNSRSDSSVTTGNIHELAVATEAFQRGLSGENTVVLSLFEDGDAAEVGIGEEEATIEAREAAAFLGKDGADGWANHGVAHAHNVDARDALANVRVNAFEVVENGFLPIVPIFVEEELAVLRGSAVSESPIKSPNGAVDVRAKALVRGVNVAESGGIEEDGVPGGLGAARIGESLESEIGGEPRGIDEIVEARKAFD